MAPEVDNLYSLSNPLATISQLSTSSSQLDGIPASLETSLRYAGAQLTQAAGILLRLPQDIIAQAIVTFYRFYLGSDGGSFRINCAKDISAASLYMNAKLSFYPQSPRSILNVYTYLLSSASPFRSPTAGLSKPDPESYFLSEGSYQAAKATLFQTESILLRSISFVTQVILPHHLALTYLQTLAALPSTPTERSTALATRTLEHLNTALLSPQLLYLTHQPPSLAVAAIYLAAREVGVKLANVEWWEVFDVDREELGFLVVALRSCEGWMLEEKQRWKGRSCPLSLEELEAELKTGEVEGP
ncbi:hypothetical protein ACLMJK_002897 [Lecanora helva]